MPYPSEHSARLKDPGGFEKFRRGKLGPGIDAIFGIKGGKSEIQAIRFDASKFSAAAARKWLAAHKYKAIRFEAARGTKEEREAMSWETLTEYVNSRGVELTTDAEQGIIRGVKVLGLSSVNGRTYLPEAINKAAGLYEGAKVNVNHPQGRKDGPRDYRDRIGQITKVRIGEDGLYADLRFNPKHSLADQLLWDASNAPENVGLSHNVQARVSSRGGKQVIEEITSVQSVDLVADPATTRGLFEEALENSTHNHKETDEMEIKELSIAQIREARQDLVEQIIAETKVEIAESEEAKKAAAELAALREENDKLKAAEALRDRKARTAKLLEEAKLPDELITEFWKGQLDGAASEEEAKALIEDRRGLAGLLKTQRPVSREQTQTTTPLDTKQVLAAITE